MGCTVEELLDRISSRELSEWMAFYQVEPWGTEPADMRAGIVASTIANVNRDPKKQRKPYHPSDFVVTWGAREKPEQTAEDQLRIIQMFQAAFAAKFEK
jgi:flagellar basal body rod protein FlgC